MNYYAAYGLTIQSAFDLPELPTIDATETPDVVFERGDVEPVLRSAEKDKSRRIRATPDRCWLTYDSIGSFCVENGHRVRFDSADPGIVETMMVRRLFENELIGLIAHQRGCLVLHASAVSIDGTAAIFIGPRGAGKSTTAAAFHAAGYELLEDDVVAVSFENGHPTVLPGVPQLRLRPDAADAVDGDTAEYPDDGGTGKRYQHFNEYPDPAPLGGCYLLREGDQFALETQSGPDPLFELLIQTYARGLLEDTDTSADHFNHCATLIETTPVQLLSRPLDHDRLSELVDFVVADLAN